MKKTALFALLCIAIAACDNKENAAPQAEGQAVNVPYRETTDAPGTNLKLSLTDVADSRCPSDVVCITMGTAELTFQVTDGSNKAEVKLSFRGNRNSDYQQFKLGDTNYILTITDVLPYPKSTETPKLEDYRVSAIIEKK